MFWFLYHNDLHPFESCIRAILADSCVFAGFGVLSPSIVKQFGRIKMFEMTTNAPTNVHIAYSSVNENTEPVDILVVSDISSMNFEYCFSSFYTSKYEFGMMSL